MSACGQLELSLKTSEAMLSRDDAITTYSTVMTFNNPVFNGVEFHKDSQLPHRHPTDCESSLAQIIMALVAYSDSEVSDDERTEIKVQKPVAKSVTGLASTNFTVDKSNPRRIQVKLQDVDANLSTNGGAADGERPAKRPKVGGGAFSGFNAMLPAPKRGRENNIQSHSGKHPSRKVFSLKTGAEPGFNRESDAELREFFAEQDATIHGNGASKGDESGITSNTSKNTAIPSSTNQEPIPKGNVFMFKPLSVARNVKKKRPANGSTKPVMQASKPGATSTPISAAGPAPTSPPKKISLFSAGQESEKEQRLVEHYFEQEPDETKELSEDNGPDEATEVPDIAAPNEQVAGPQPLDSIASDLNLSEAERRRLFGRSGKTSAAAINIVNFNTDQEYAANEAFRASGEQIQHNPVRAIAPGKHSLKQLVSAAAGQKEALEESFAAGKRNKKEAGNRYGW